MGKRKKKCTKCSYSDLQHTQYTHIPYRNCVKIKNKMGKKKFETKDRSSRNAKRAYKAYTAQYEYTHSSHIFRVDVTAIRCSVTCFYQFMLHDFSVMKYRQHTTQTTFTIQNSFHSIALWVYYVTLTVRVIFFPALFSFPIRYLLFPLFHV